MKEQGNTGQLEAIEGKTGQLEVLQSVSPFLFLLPLCLSASGGGEDKDEGSYEGDDEGN